MLTTDKLTFSYARKGNPVIKNFTFQLESGTICGLLGRNGSGKSTLLYLLCGLLKPATGTIDYNGEIPYERKKDFLSDIFIVPEEFELPGMKLSEFAEVNSAFYPRFDQKAFEDYLKLFEIDSSMNLAKISMGQKKKAFLSFALACNTSLLILDEPTNGLDISSKRSFRKALSLAMTDDKTIIISTHQVFDVEKIIDHVIIMDSSKVLLNESIYDISNKLSFKFTPDTQKAKDAILAIEAPGGAYIVEPTNEPETEVNLELLFELAQTKPEFIQNIFPSK